MRKAAGIASRGKFEEDREKKDRERLLNLIHRQSDTQGLFLLLLSFLFLSLLLTAESQFIILAP